MATKLKFSPFQIAVLLVFLAALAVLKILEFHFPKAIIEVDGQRLEVLVAKTQKHAFRGLGRRDSLEPYDGMLFVFPELRRPGIVMRDMRFPIDIIWLKNGVIVDIAPNVPLEPGVKEEDLRVYFPRDTANAVLEMPAGEAMKRGFAIGDTLQLVDN